MIYTSGDQTFVKTDRNSLHLLECGKGLYFCNFGPPWQKLDPLEKNPGSDPVRNIDSRRNRHILCRAI